MRTLALAALPILFAVALVGCDDKEKSVAPSGTKDAGVPVASATASAAPIDAGAPASTASVAGPERPIPKPQTTVGAGAPQETQMKAIGYMFAMRAPHPDDAPIDEAFVTDLVTKLKPVVLAMDKGPDKTKWNRVETEAKGRQIDLLMSDGCDAKAPFNAVVQRLNTPLATLLAHGVLAVRCNDTKHQCYQSTRDPDDVLCATGIRHNK